MYESWDEAVVISVGIICYTIYKITEMRARYDVCKPPERDGDTEDL